VNWADLMAAQGAFGTDVYDRSTRTIVGTMLGTEYRPVIKIGPKGALGSHEIRPIHSAPSLGQSIAVSKKGNLLVEIGKEIFRVKTTLEVEQPEQHYRIERPGRLSFFPIILVRSKFLTDIRILQQQFGHYCRGFQRNHDGLQATGRCNESRS